MVTDWARHREDLAALPIGYFGASTGAAAALIAAADRPADVGAIVSRGGRPDLAGRALLHVQAPTLLIVGGDDEPVVEMNRSAMRALPALARLEIVPRRDPPVRGARHLGSGDAISGRLVWAVPFWARPSGRHRPRRTVKARRP